MLFSSCMHDARERERRILEKLSNDAMLFTFQLNELTREIARCEEQKAEHIAFRRRAEAEACLRERHKLKLQAKQMRSRLDFTNDVLDKIKNTSVIKEHMQTLHEAHKVFKTFDAPKMVGKFDELSQSFNVYSDQITDAQSMFSTRLAEPLTQTDDDELMAELEALSEQMAAPAAPAGGQAAGSGTASAGVAEPPPGVSIARAYASRVYGTAVPTIH